MALSSSLSMPAISALGAAVGSSSSWRPRRQRRAHPPATLPQQRVQRAPSGRPAGAGCLRAGPASAGRRPASACARSAAPSASARAGARPRSAAAWPCVSTKPASTVSGVRISCDTLATKSRRMRVGALALGDVLRQHELHGPRRSGAPAPTACAARAASANVDRLVDSRRPAGSATKAGARTRLVTRWLQVAHAGRGRSGRPPRELHQSIWSAASSSITPLGEASMAARNCASRSRSSRDRPLALRAARARCGSPARPTSPASRGAGARCGPRSQSIRRWPRAACRAAPSSASTQRAAARAERRGAPMRVASSRRPRQPTRRARSARASQHASSQPAHR